MTKQHADEPATSEELSRSARAVVHDEGDPRIDAHLRALGLAPDSPEPVAKAPAAEANSEALSGLQSRITELEAAAVASGRRVQWLAVALGVAILLVVVLAAILVARPG